MDLTINTSLRTTLSQKMLLSTKILQMSTQELIDYLKELSVENPVVELEEQQFENLMKQKIDWLTLNDEQNKDYYREEKSAKNEPENYAEYPRETLREHLLSQVNILPLEPWKLETAHYVIECLDRNGYLCDDIGYIAQTLHLDEARVREVLDIVKSLEPAGVGASGLKECLLLQLGRLGIKCPAAERIISDELEALGKNQINIIAKKLKISVAEAAKASGVIRSLNPKPGNSFASERKPEYIIPDILISENKGNFDISLNESGLPVVSINNFYKTILRTECQDDAKKYVCDKIRQAEWVVKCISRRGFTLTKTLEVITELQKGFFDQGPGNLVPMTLDDIAKRIGVHDSTVCRATKNKYIQCRWGVFPLSYFFSAAVHTKGEVSTEKIKSLIKRIVDGEDRQKPLSDREITEALGKRSIDISRRTVSKYREALGIAGAAGRREFKE